MPFDRIQNIGVHGLGNTNCYVIDFTFTGSGIIFNDWQVIEFDNSALAQDKFDLLIGRDVLQHAVLVYDGERGEIGIELPITQHPLDKPPWPQAPKVMTPKKPVDKRIERNKRKRKAKKKKKK